MTVRKTVAVLLAGASLAAGAAAVSAQMVNNPGPRAWTPSGDVTVHPKSADSRTTGHGQDRPAQDGAPAPSRQ